MIANQDKPYTGAEILSIVERLHPDRLLLLRSETGLDDEALKLLCERLAKCADPRCRLAAVEYLSLIMHEARAIDAVRYLGSVFLPWIGIQKRIRPQMRRIAEEFERMGEFEAYSTEDAAHSATKIYRPLVANVFDPYMTLFVATYHFKDGTFNNIEETNLGSHERSKAEFVEARIRRFGGPPDLLSGYDPLVRNALSHAGSEGVLYESSSILFREIKRGVPPKVETRRWSHNDLHMSAVKLLELFMAIDATVEVFGIDCMELLSEKPLSDKVMFHALDRSKREEIRTDTQAKFEQIRRADGVPFEKRFKMLALLFFRQCAERDIACESAGYKREAELIVLQVPLKSKVETDDEIQTQSILLVRYAIIARAVFGTLFGTFMVAGRFNGGVVVSVELQGPILDEYAAERAGLYDLLAASTINIGKDTVRIELDEAAISAAEDARLGPRLPRLDRPASD